MKRDDVIFFKTRKLEELDFLSNSPPSVFIGSKLKYPNVNVGILTPSQPLKQVQILNNSNEWTNLDLSIKQILNLRNQLINSRYQTQVKITTKLTEKSQEIGMSLKPTDLELNLEKAPRYMKEMDKITKPLALSAPLKNIRITQNTKIHTKVDKVFSDTELKAGEAINYLYRNEFDESFLQQLLSIGTLGLKKNRRLVPTRWSITATDDIIGKEILNEVRNYNKIDEHRLFFDNYLGNYYFILLLPELFGYELFEYSMRHGQIKEEWTDFEDYFGRKNYASNSVGGYYSVRLSVLEYLKKIKRQASVFVIRFETEEYWANLGVWVTRNCARRAMNNKYISFYSRENAIDFMKNFIFNKMKVETSYVFNKSKLLNIIREQKGLREFF
jgi:hypothetical protein